MKCTNKTLCWLISATIAAVIIVEVFARYYLGLGTPPLYIVDEQIEYMLKPNQDVTRFGNHVFINHYGMRSDVFSEKRGKSEIRVMIFGDSVLNGGNLTTQADLATSILHQNLSALTGKNVVVGNISAGSWGPGNWLAYADTYGFFDADIVVLVASSHDYSDNPTFEALNPNTHPTEKPLSALTEGITRYLPRYLPKFTSTKSKEIERFTEHTTEQAIKGHKDLSKFLTLAQKNTGSVLVFQHWENDEINSGKAKLGNAQIRVLSESMGIPTVSLKPYFKSAMDSGQNPYHDNVHPNALGHELIANAILDKLLDV